MGSSEPPPSLSWSRLFSLMGLGLILSRLGLSSRLGPDPRPIALAALLAMSGCEGARPAGPNGVLTPAPPAVVAPPTPVPTPSPTTVENRAPELFARVKPKSLTGTAPLEVTVDLCGSADPDGDPLVYAYEWEREGKQLSSECRAHHIYDRPTRSQAVCCVWDRHPEHLVCTTRPVDVQ